MPDVHVVRSAERDAVAEAEVVVAGQARPVANDDVIRASDDSAIPVDTMPTATADVAWLTHAS